MTSFFLPLKRFPDLDELSPSALYCNGTLFAKILLLENIMLNHIVMLILAAEETFGHRRFRQNAKLVFTLMFP
jgi:hypothetical protein